MFTKIWRIFRLIFEVIQVGLPFDIHFSGGLIVYADLGFKRSGVQHNVEFLSILIFTSILFSVIHGAAAVLQSSEKLMEKTQRYCLQASISKACPKEQLT